MKKALVMSFLLLLASHTFAQNVLTFPKIETLSLNPYCEILIEAYQKLGITIIFEKLPDKRALQSVNEGIYDGEVIRVAGIDKEYTNLIPVNVPLTTAFVYAYKLNKNPIKSINAGCYALAIRGRIMVERVIIDMHLSVDFISTPEQALQMLMIERADVIIDVSTAIDPILEAMELSDYIGKMEPPLLVQEAYHYLHKKNKHLIPQIEAVLREMKENGRIQEILNK